MNVWLFLKVQQLFGGLKMILSDFTITIEDKDIRGIGPDFFNVSLRLIDGSRIILSKKTIDRIVACYDTDEKRTKEWKDWHKICKHNEFVS